MASVVHEERVLVVPTVRFRELGYFQGFTRDVDSYLPELFNAQHLSYRPRSEMEEDPSYKQLIPYVVFRWVDPHSKVAVFHYTRGQGQAEGRLRSKKSIGVGGHISTVDASASAQSDPYREGMRRELDEEVVIETEVVDRCVGLINDDETDVGRVHLGIVHLLDVNEPAVRAREDDICDAGFMPVHELLENLDGFETWSQICLQALFADEDGT